MNQPLWLPFSGYVGAHAEGHKSYAAQTQVITGNRQPAKGRSCGFTGKGALSTGRRRGYI
jgi:hypothetical protein